MTAVARARRRLPRPTVSAVLAAGLVLLGVVVTLWRPLAPALPAVTTDLDRLGDDVLAAIQAYREPRIVAVVVLQVLGVLVPLAFVLTRTGRRVVDAVAGQRHERWRGPLRGALLAVALTVTMALVGLPIRAWAGLVQDGAWQVRTEDAASWWVRLATGTAVDLLVVAAVAAGLVWLVRHRPRTWPTDAVLGGVALVAVGALLWPVAVLPLTTPVGPLGDGPTERAVRETIADAGMADLPVAVTRRSEQDVRSNALVAGLGPTRRILVDDTLLARPTDEVVAVVAHELAHGRHHDVVRAVLGSAALVLVLMLVVHAVWQRVRRWNGRRRAVDDPRLVVVGLVTMALLTPVLEPVGLWQSRRVETAADAAAHDLGAAPDTTIRLQRRLAIDNLQPLVLPTWQVVLWSSHPSGADRVRNAVARARRDGASLPSRAELLAEEAADPPAWERP